MLLSEIIHASVIKTNLDAQNKDEAISELVDTLIQAKEIPLSKRYEILEDIFARERSHGTGMEYGIALPHAATDHVVDVIVALGISRRGVPFECHDGLPAKLLILLLIPKRNFAGHVHTLAAVAHLFCNAKFREALLAAPDADAALRLITRQEELYVQSEQSPA